MPAPQAPQMPSIKGAMSRGQIVRGALDYMNDRNNFQLQQRNAQQNPQQMMPGGGTAPPPGGLEQWQAYRALRSPYGKSGRKAQAAGYMAYQDKYGGGYDPSGRFNNAKMMKYIEKLRRKGGT